MLHFGITKWLQLCSLALVVGLAASSSWGACSGARVEGVSVGIRGAAAPSRLLSGDWNIAETLSPTLRLRGGEDDSDGDEDEEEGGETDGGETNPDYVMERHEFNHVIRVLNTNIDGTRTVLYALTMVKGVGRRFGHAVITRAGIDASKRAGSLSPEEIERLVQVIENPHDYDIPAWMLNRRKDWETGKDLHNVINKLDLQLRLDHERMRKMRLHRGLRHAWGFKVRGQHTKTTGRGRFRAGPVKASNKPGRKK